MNNIILACTIKTTGCLTAGAFDIHEKSWEIQKQWLDILRALLMYKDLTFSCFPSFIGSLSSKFTQKLNPPPPAKTGLRIINQSNKKEATQHYSIFKNDKVNIPEVAV